MKTISAYLYLLILLPLSLCACGEDPPPFDYDLHLTRLSGENAKTMICFHGMGGNYRVAHALKKTTKLAETLVSFNFPDHSLKEGAYDPYKTTFGTIQELLPAIYVLKQVIVVEGNEEVNLYGFSAGGGAIINVLAILNSSRYDSFLTDINVTLKDKQKMLEVIQRGYIILDAPLKSVAEIIAFRGLTEELNIVGKRYCTNEMEPIDILPQLANLALHFIVHFQVPDEILSNRDDELFIERLEQYNQKGTTSVVIGSDGGHIRPHYTLWEFYLQKKHLFKEIKSEL